MPPSPRLSSRMMTRMYFTVTITMSDHTDEGEHAVDGACLMRQAHLRTEAGAKGVERAGADVSVDHAKGGEGEDAQPAAARPRSIAWNGGRAKVLVGDRPGQMSIEGHGSLEDERRHEACHVRLLRGPVDEDMIADAVDCLGRKTTRKECRVSPGAAWPG